MLNLLRRTALCLTAVAALLVPPLASSHFDDKEVLQSYRQSWFALVATNAGPLFAMAEGEIPWNDVQFASATDQLVQLTAMDISKGFAPGTDKGKTRAKPEIWKNLDDFNAKMQDMRDAAARLQLAVNSGDKASIGKGVQDLGGSCKACHDEYKSENYLY